MKSPFTISVGPWVFQVSEKICKKPMKSGSLVIFVPRLGMTQLQA
jgi:hypothetical protein